MIIRENVSIKRFNTFGIDVKTRFFIEVFSQKELAIFIRQNLYGFSSFLVLGGGSNILFLRDYDGVIIKMSSKGITQVDENEENVFIKVQAGETWDDFVKYCVENSLGGIENLSLIPGTVGACPIQNIGAYGSEVKDTIVRVETLNTENGNICEFLNKDCKFGYRNSIFKNEVKGKHIITSVIFKLFKNPQPNIAYKSLAGIFEKNLSDKITISAVRQAVCAIRKEKLPDPEKLGNAGSFFKNPIISQQKYNELKTIFPDFPAYVQIDGSYKIAAGWLIEQTGWKGKRLGEAGVHEKQALVLINFGKATGMDIWNLSEKIILSVFEKFGTRLEREVNIV
ncbi:MAG: UDP-N-acetylmuramate dehydrogenase [Lentimicrobiaceae bacterium]|nr:UDP-N-acetylmuramate dehydrogenase [Lentimicrobiaceae bacterium]